MSATTTGFGQPWVFERLGVALRAGAAEADGAEALFRANEASHLRLAESAIIQASRVTEGQLAMRVVIDGRAARATTTDLSDEGISTCAKVATARARSAPAREERVQLPPPTPSLGVRAPIHGETAWLDAPTKERWLGNALKAHRRDGLALAGRFHTGLMTMAVASTEGVEAYHQGSFSDVALSALERPAGHGASSYRAAFDSRVDAEVIERLQHEVREECHRAHDPVEIDPGHWDVVLAPAAVAELMEWMGMIAFRSSVLEDGTSFVASRSGEQVTGDSVSITDDASMPEGVGVALPFDVEGQPKQRVRLVESGVARGVVHDTMSAQRAGCQGTGHAQLDDIFPEPGSGAGHLHMEPGATTQEALIQRVNRGLFVTRFHYVNGMLEPRRAVMTGLLRDGAFLIEDGRLGRAVRPMRFMDSILDAFSRIPGRDGISSAVEAHSSWFGPNTCTVVPSVLIPELRFTSGR